MSGETGRIIGAEALLRWFRPEAGYVSPEARPDFFGQMDAANVDLKAFPPAFYRDYFGAELEPVKETLVYLARETRVWLEVPERPIWPDVDVLRPSGGPAARLAPQGDMALAVARLLLFAPP